jgi:fused signal recognition particle receptor
MGFFSKLKDVFKRKKDVSSEIKKQREEKSEIEVKKFDEGLKKSSSSLNDAIKNIAKKFVKVDQDLIDNIEELLINFDIGSASTTKILDSIVEEIKLQNVNDPKLIKKIIVDKLFVYYIQNTEVDTSLNIKEGINNVILVSGVNGVGKTTSIAKLANMFKNQNKKVLVIAADTFRAGAVAQLEV